jgi:hypothetical protein
MQWAFAKVMIIQMMTQYHTQIQGKHNIQAQVNQMHTASTWTMSLS